MKQVKTLWEKTQPCDVITSIYCQLVPGSQSEFFKKIINFLNKFLSTELNHLVSQMLYYFIISDIVICN